MLMSTQSIVHLLNNCQKLTHLSLTGVQAFLRQDLERFCREAPQGKASVAHFPPHMTNYLSTEFTDHQRNVFCVFSGAGVTGLRNHLNSYEHGHAPDDDDFDQDTVGDDDQTMTGMMGATALNADEEDADADGDEELEDGDGGGATFAAT